MRNVFIDHKTNQIEITNILTNEVSTYPLNELTLWQLFELGAFPTFIFIRELQRINAYNEPVFNGRLYAMLFKN